MSPCRGSPRTKKTHKKKANEILRCFCQRFVLGPRFEIETSSRKFTFNFSLDIFIWKKKTVFKFNVEDELELSRSWASDEKTNQGGKRAEDEEKLFEWIGGKMGQVWMKISMLRWIQLFIYVKGVARQKCFSLICQLTQLEYAWRVVEASYLKSER